MKIGIIGDAERAIAWEQHLRPHRIVEEVNLCPHIQEVGAVDACFILDDSEQNLDILLKGIRRELNCFLISKSPEDRQKLERIHHSAMEAGVNVQFSHWPVLAPASQWMINRMRKPAAISIQREVAYTQWLNAEAEFRQLWIDELGLCLKWVNSGIHQIEAKQIMMEGALPLFMHLFLRFDNGTTADIKIDAGASENQHRRTAADKHQILDCDVKTQKIRVGKLNNQGQLYFEKQQFDPATAAEKTALMFLKAVQMKTETVYSSYDAYQLAVQIERVEKRLKQFY